MPEIGTSGLTSGDGKRGRSASVLAPILDSTNTAEMIRGYIKSMEANHLKIPLSAVKLTALKRPVGLG